ncbi:MAG: Bax inhibitor-1 family protein [Kiritimatiellia bacterium]
MTTNVFQRTLATSPGCEISESRFHFTLGLTLFWGFFVNYLIVQYAPLTFLAIPRMPILFLIAYFVLGFTGIRMVEKATHTLPAFIGYNLIVLPLGFSVKIAILSLQLTNPEAYLSILQSSILYTGGITLCMMILGSSFPKFFRGVLPILTISLLLVIAFELIGGLVFHQQMPRVLDWIVLLIFCGYIGVDWGRASAIPKTTCNAVSVAASIYIDIVNLFITILNILNRKGRN